MFKPIWKLNDIYRTKTQRSSCELSRYTCPLIANNWKRLIWQVKVVVDTVPKGSTVMDLGAGIVPFTPALDQFLQLRRSLCSDIYLYTWKKGTKDEDCNRLF